MPEFADVAAHFDDTEALDGYTQGFLFYAQFNTFDEASMDGSINKKRSMSVRPGTPIPQRRVLEVLGERWIIADGNTDGFGGLAVRTSYWLKKVTSEGEIYMPGQFLNGQPGNFVYLQKDFRKETVNGVTNSEYSPFFDIYTAPSELVHRGCLFLIGTSLFRARASYTDLSGLTLSACDQLDWNTVTVTYQGGVLDPVTEEWVGGTVSMQGLVLEMYQLYYMNTEADAKMHSGDRTLVTPLEIPAGTVVQIDGKKWTVLNSQTELDAYKHHIRRA